MEVGIIGSGKIGANIGRRAAEAGHGVIFSFSRDPASLDRLAEDVGHGATSGQPNKAAAADIVVLAVPWALIDQALNEAGPLDGKIVVDTTNPFGPTGLVPLADGMATGKHNQQRMPGASVVKAFNTLTAGFQAAAKKNDGQTAMFIAGEDAEAKLAVGELVRAVGFEPVDLGGWSTAVLMDAPRRHGAVYGEAYALNDAREIAEAAASDMAAAARLAATRKV